VKFSDSDRAEYKKLESSALESYFITLKQYKVLGKAVLKLYRILQPLRIACAGGHVPLSGKNEDGDSDDEEETGKQRKKPTIKYSDYAFTSKFSILIDELKHVRDKDPKGKHVMEA